METQFTILTADLKRVMTEVKRLSPKSVNIDVSISVQPDRIELQFVGITRFITATTANFCDVVVPFKILEAISKTVNSKEIHFRVSKGQLEYERVKLVNKQIRIESLFTNPDSPLPLNMSAKVLLSLRKKQTNEYLEKQGLILFIEQEEAKLEKKLQAAAKSLKEYGVSYQMIKSLVEQNIG